MKNPFKRGNELVIKAEVSHKEPGVVSVDMMIRRNGTFSQEDFAVVLAEAARHLGLEGHLKIKDKNIPDTRDKPGIA